MNGMAKNKRGLELASVPLIGLAVLALAAQPASSAQPAPQAGVTADQCSALARTRLANIEIVSAALQPAMQPVPGAMLPVYFGGAAPQPISGLPAFCRIIALAHPEPGSEVKFEVWMPASGWNGRFFGTGNGGFAGPLEYMGMGAAIKSGYATASTDTGHEGNGQQSGWAKGNPQKIRDYGWRGIHLMTANAKTLVAALYGRPADKAYFSSCSNGGRQALMEAARYPEDYDGIVAGAPAAPFTKLIMSMNWTQRAQSAPGAALRPAQIKLLQDETLRQCDTRDEQSDGLIVDPRQCRIDVSRMACGASDSAQCLAPAQVTALERIQQGPRTSRGKQVAFPYLLSGADAGTPIPYLGWEGWITGFGGLPASHALFPKGILEDFVARPFATPESFNWDRDPAKLAATAGRDIDVSPNLSRYFARGGKLIIWHGWADAAIPAQNAIEYTEQALRRSGPRSAQSLRLFLIPGMQHCFGGTGAINFGSFQAPPPGAMPEDNMLTAMEHWVERGRVPETVVGRMGANPVAPPAPDARQRLHCAWPKQPRLTSGANPDLAANYTCG